MTDSPATSAIDPLAVLKQVFGYDRFRPGQEAIVSSLLDGDHVLAVMPTGSGKSLGFQIPAILKGGLTLVVSPLVALMEDQVAGLLAAGVAADAINSSRTYETNAAAWRRVAAGQVRLLYMAPERLMTERMLNALGRLPLSLIAIDEAHCISRWGPSFRPDYEALASLRERFPGVPIGAFTATADQATRDDIAAKLFGGVGRIFVSGFDRPNIHLTVGPRDSGPRQLLQFVERRAGQSGIVYCLSRKKTEETALLLRQHGVAALAYHAGMDKAARTVNQDRFMTEPGVVMVATIAFGMGIDKPDVRYVFHRDLPGSMEAYYQEVGRAGRDSLPAEAHLLYGLDDIRMRRFFIEEEMSEAGHKRREHKRLDALIAYCEAPECRRRTLLSYFGEDSGACGNCDVCTDPPELEDGVEVGRAALSAVMASGQRFGAAHVIDILRGADTEKIRGFGHDRLESYGADGDLSKNAWRSIIRQLVAAGHLMLDVAGHGGLSLTPKGHGLRAGEVGFSYRKDATPAKRKKAARSKAETVAVADLAPADNALYAALKEQRLSLAQARGVPAYVIFSDRSLADMATRRPRDETAFAEVHGVGEAKRRDLAVPFLAVIDSFVEEAS